jgi:hypothetical protein
MQTDTGGFALDGQRVAGGAKQRKGSEMRGRRAQCSGTNARHAPKIPHARLFLALLVAAFATALSPTGALADEAPETADTESVTDAAPAEALPNEGEEKAAAATDAPTDAQRRVPGAEEAPASRPYKPFEICDWCPPQRRAPTLDRCDVNAGYFEAACNPKKPRCGPWWKPVHGDLRVEYRMRSTGSETDHTAWEFANVRFGDQEAAGWSGAFHGALIQNFDPSDTPGFDPLFSIWDTYGDATGQLYHAYVTYRPERGLIRMAQLGRMWIDAGEVIQVDGAQVEFWPSSSRRTRDLSITTFAGVPSYLFDSGPQGDFTAGFIAKSKLWRNARARLSYAYIKNGESIYGNIGNNLTTLTVDQCLRPGYNIQLRYQQIDDKPRYLTARVNALSTRSDVQITGWVNTLLSEQTQQVYDTDLYYGVLRSYEPYIEGYLSASKGIGRHFDVQGLLAIRRLYDSADIRAFNREFERYSLTVSAFDWPSPRWSASLTGEWWNDTEDYGAATFDVEWRPSSRLRLRVGTDYSLFSNDVFSLQERVDSYGVYGRVRYDFNTRLQGWLRLRVEKDSYDTYTLLRTGLTWEF